MLVAQEEVEIVRNLFSELVPSTESPNSPLILPLLNTGSLEAGKIIESPVDTNF